MNRVAAAHRVDPIFNPRQQPYMIQLMLKIGTIRVVVLHCSQCSPSFVDSVEHLQVAAKQEEKNTVYCENCLNNEPKQERKQARLSVGRPCVVCGWLCVRGENSEINKKPPCFYLKGVLKVPRGRACFPTCYAPLYCFVVAY